MTRSFLIRYRGGDGEVTERRISHLVADGHSCLTAHCHLRGADRTFRIDAIEQMVDAETAEVIDDVRRLLGLPLSVPAIATPVVDSPPATLADAQVRRKKDKYALFARFRLPVLQHWARCQLIGLFGGRCFKCQAAGRMDIDHVVPLMLGGRLVPGNLCVLCPACNSRKHDVDPRVFYSEYEMQRLRPLLDRQQEIFRFVFDFRAWEDDPGAYLLSLGLPPNWIEAVLDQPGRRFYFERDGSTVMEPLLDDNA